MWPTSRPMPSPCPVHAHLIIYIYVPQWSGPPQDHHRAGTMCVVGHSQPCSDTDVSPLAVHSIGMLYYRHSVRRTKENFITHNALV